jgi:hypothetical protein
VALHALTGGRLRGWGGGARQQERQGKPREKWGQRGVPPQSTLAEVDSPYERSEADAERGLCEVRDTFR